MNPQHTFCPNAQCPARGQRAKGNIVIHSRKEQHYRCKLCGKTFSARDGTVFFRARVQSNLITLVLTLIAYGCPLPAIEAAFGFQARTVRRWLEVAGAHCEKVHQEQVVQPQALGQVQADELRKPRHELSRPFAIDTKLEFTFYGTQTGLLWRAILSRAARNAGSSKRIS